ncbi:MAG: diguanylate cyclase [Clostridiales bacterium]|jgi:diguanylate cyclase (GGDEF)-like protein|nr:diguanylate cyclase [Clostridiales bacterium]
MPNNPQIQNEDAKPSLNIPGDDDLRNFMRGSFYRLNRTKYDDIVRALSEGNIAQAHRWAHNLKSNAGMIEEEALQKAALEAELLLKDGENLLTEEHLAVLKREFDLVLNDLNPNIQPEEVKTPTAENKKTSLLIIDDEATNLMALVHILGKDYKIYSAQSGQEAIKKAEEFSPDMILLDILMPVMDGYEVIAHLKSSEKTKHIPVIFVSGLDSVESEEKGLQLGAVDYIIKPFRAAIVKLRVDNQIKMLEQIKMIERLSMIDQLTNIANRRSFDNRLSVEWNNAARQATPVSLLMIDVDLFKNYNDKWGHQQGDVALKKIAEVFTKSLKRKSDFTARWGGEEFVVLLPGTDAKGGLNIAECIRKKIEAAEIPYKGKITKVTISVGVNTVVPNRNNSIDTFISGADTALYRAKETGRNKVCVYEN